MVLEPEKSTVPHVHHVVDGVRSGEPPIGDGNAGFGDRHVAAIHISGAFGVLGGSGHAARLSSSYPGCKGPVLRLGRMATFGSPPPRREPFPIQVVSPRCRTG